MSLNKEVIIIVGNRYLGAPCDEYVTDASSLDDGAIADAIEDYLERHHDCWVANCPDIGIEDLFEATFYIIKEGATDEL